MPRELWEYRIIEEGAFDKACRALLKNGFKLSWADKFGDNVRPEKPVGRIKYTCEDCGLNAWAKPKVSLVCGECKIQLTSDDE